MSFDSFNLRATSLEALRAQGIITPTPIQAESIPQLLEGKDVIGQAYHRLRQDARLRPPADRKIDPQNKWLQALVLVPTRELAQQVGDVLDALGSDAGIRADADLRRPRLRPAAGRDLPRRAGRRRHAGTRARPPDSAARCGSTASRYLVLDEADEMLDRGFAPDVERILSQTPRSGRPRSSRRRRPSGCTRSRRSTCRSRSSSKRLPTRRTSRTSSTSSSRSGTEDKFDVLLALLDEPTKARRSSSGARSTASAIWRVSSSAWATAWTCCRAT